MVYLLEISTKGLEFFKLSKIFCVFEVVNVYILNNCLLKHFKPT